jgi:hypothetical protein
MTAEARALAQTLVAHHKSVCAPGRPADSCLIVYGTLCERAGVPFLTRGVGPFLREVAEWCAANAWPPINALAVNRETRMPGEGYDGAPGCSLVDWAREVRAAIDFQGYPDKL